MLKDYSWNPSTCICEDSKYLKSIADTSVTECEEIIIVMNNVSRKKTNTIAANVTSTAWINCHSKNVRICYIPNTVLLAIILLLKIIIICCRLQNKKEQYKIENYESKNICITKLLLFQ